MHTEENFLHTCIENIEEYGYAFIGKCWSYQFFFLYRDHSWELKIKKVDLLSIDELRDRAREDFDAYETWKEEVADWSTEQGFRDWEDDVSIWDYKDDTDYYWASEDVCSQLDELGYWYGWYNDYHWDDYLDEENWGNFTKENVENLGRLLDKQWLNEALLGDMENHFWVREVEFLDCEDIR